MFKLNTDIGSKQLSTAAVVVVVLVVYMLQSDQIAAVAPALCDASGNPSKPTQRCDPLDVGPYSTPCID